MSTTIPPMTWNLSDPGMGLLERAGLAALYMSLRAAKEMGEDLAPLLWKPGDLTPESVTLHWEGTDEAAITKLMRWAWQVRDKVLYLPAIHRGGKPRDNAFLRLASHNGILNTALQHTKVQPKGEIIERYEAIEEGKEMRCRFQSLDPDEISAILRSRAQNSAAARKNKQAVQPEKPTKSPKKAGLASGETLKPLIDLGSARFFDSKGKFSSKEIKLSSWVMPGIAPRYGSEPAWIGPGRQALLLLLAPIACLFEHMKGEGDNWIMVVPEVLDLVEFDSVRPTLGLDPRFTDVASLGDAGLRFSSEYAARSVGRELAVGCLVVAMGYVTYYASQRIRKSVLEVVAAPSSIRRYAHLHRAMPNRSIPIRAQGRSDSSDHVDGHDARPAEDLRQRVFFVTPTGRGRIADNLIAGRPWYADLFTPLAWDRDDLERERKRSPGTSLERLWFRNLSFQKESLMELIREQAMWDSENGRILVEAFWEAIRSLYAQEADAAKRGGSRSINERIEHLNDDIFRRLMRSKTRDLLRETLAELFAKSGRQKTLRANPAVVWNLIDDPHDWKRARDLALLALATYSKKQEDAAPDPSAPDQGDDA